MGLSLPAARGDKMPPQTHPRGHVGEGRRWGSREGEQPRQMEGHLGPAPSPLLLVQVPRRRGERAGRPGEGLGEQGNSAVSSGGSW